MHNVYSQVAKLYDLDNRPVFHADIPFYLERAKRLNGKVLELACGTGRVTMPLAENGISIWGLDFSSSMLEVFEEKLSKVEPSLRNRTHLILGDMTNFDLPEAFKLIFIPFRSLQALANDTEVSACLSAVYRHLDSDGQFIFNVFRPIQPIADGWVNLDESLDFENIIESGEKVTRHSIRRSHNVEDRLLYIDYTYRMYSSSGEVRQLQDSIRLRYYYEEDIRQLLTEAGFDIVEAYGWYDGTSIDAGNEMIFVCRKV